MLSYLLAFSFYTQGKYLLMQTTLLEHSRIKQVEVICGEIKQGSSNGSNASMHRNAHTGQMPT